MHALFQCPHILGRDEESLFSRGHQIRRGADLRRGDDRKTCGQGLIDHDSPSVVPTGKNEDIGFGKEVGELAWRDEAAQLDGLST